MTCSQSTEDSTDKVNIMEPDPELTSLAINFFPKIQLSTLLRTDKGTLKKKSVVWKRFYKTAYWDV